MVQDAVIHKGDLLVEFDLALLKQEGYDPTVILIATDMDRVQNLQITAQSAVYAQTTLMTLESKEA